MEFASSAFRHGISQSDAEHAYRNRIGVWILDDSFRMLVGPGEHGQLLEIGVARREENDIIVHAMPAREKFLRRSR